MFTSLHRSHQFLKRAEKPAAGEIRVAIVGNTGRMDAQPAPAEGCEDTEVPGF